MSNETLEFWIAFVAVTGLWLGIGILVAVVWSIIRAIGKRAGK